MLRAKAQGWRLLVATSGEEALRTVREQHVDAVVSDMRMPGMDGAALLAAVQRERPATARIILSGQAERGAVLAAVSSAQQFLAKPCDADEIVAAVCRAVTVRRLLSDGRLLEIVGAVGSLPKPPEVYQRLVEVVSRDDVDLADVARVLDDDLATRAEVLKLVNSAFFGLPRPVETVESAVSLLGLDNIQALVLASSLFRTGDPMPPGLDGEDLHARGVRRAAVARALADLEGLHDQRDTVVLAALLYDVGLLVLAAGMPDAYAALAAAQELGDVARRAELEHDVFGCTTTAAAACLLGLWAFPELLVHMLATQPVEGSDVGASPAEHVLAAAQLKALGAWITPWPGGFVDEGRAVRWNTAAEAALEGL